MSKREKNKVSKKEKKQLSDTKRVVLFTIVIIVVVSLIGFLSILVLKDKDENESTDTVKKNTHEILGYGITVDDLDSEYYKLEFEKLKTNLLSENINYDEYAESVAKLFLIDLYTIKTKINKYDIGGLEEVIPEARDNYVNNITDTIYKYVEDNTNGKRTQSLPVVSEVSVKNVKKSEYKIDSLNTKIPSYVFEFDISYSSDLGYDTKAEVTVVNRDNFMYVVEKN